MQLTGKRPDLLIGLGILAVTLAVYAQIGNHAFTNYDDDGYITENYRVLQGLSLAGVKWAFTTLTESNWHPLTWLSHMLDCHLFGQDAGLHHWMNLVLHLVNTALLLALLLRMTGARWPSALVAAGFALHPLHVQSVAWAAERKDVLSTVFWLLTMHAYVGFVHRRGGWRYGLVCLCLGLGLLAKPMLVTLPCVLLLIDVWPLGRPLTARLVVEKLPLFALVAASCVVTYVAQKTGGAVKTLPIDLRLANVVVSYAAYLGMMVWPVELTVFYPFPAAHPLGQVVVSIGVLVVVTIVAVVWRRQRPWFIIGWLWYLGTLVPVIGLLRVGEQALADRYTYIPLIGIFILLAWGAQELVRIRPALRWPVVGTAGLLLVLAAAGTAYQVTFWRNAETLFTRAIAVTSDNYVAHNQLGLVVFDSGDAAAAERHFQTVLAIYPENITALNNIGKILAERRDFAGARPYFEHTLANHPNNLEALNNLGVICYRQKRPDQAIEYLRRAAQLAPDNASSLRNLGLCLQLTGKITEAVHWYERALWLNPADAQAHYYLGVAHYKLKHLDAAIEQMRAVLRLAPGHADATRVLKQLTTRRRQSTPGDK